MENNENLMWAALEGNLQKVNELLGQGVDPNAKTANGVTALMFAARGYIGIAKLLLDRGADPNAEDNEGNTALIVAEGYTYPEIVELLKQHGAAN